MVFLGHVVFSDFAIEGFARRSIVVAGGSF